MKVYHFDNKLEIEYKIEPRDSETRNQGNLCYMVYLLVITGMFGIPNIL